MGFIETSLEILDENFYNLIGKEWMLVAAGDRSGYNMMTASWGSIGMMWGKPCALTVIRPGRYTHEFVDKHDYFSLSFYGADKSMHSVCGTKSGREVDKTKETGLVPVFDNSTVYFEQARIVLICRKLYKQQLKKSCFLDETIDSMNYNGDYHTAFVGEIVKVLVKE